MQSLQPDPNAQYRSVYEALKRIIQTEGVFRPLRGLNITMMGAGPAHALYFACYERVKRSLSDVIQSGGNSHLANGMSSHVSTHITGLSYEVFYTRLSNMAWKSVVRISHVNAVSCLQWQRQSHIPNMKNAIWDVWVQACVFLSFFFFACKHQEKMGNSP